MKLHTPYDGSSKPFQIGLKPLDLATWIEVDEDLGAYLKEKQRLLALHPSKVFVAEPGTQVAQGEVLALLWEHLPKHYPDIYNANEFFMTIKGVGDVTFEDMKFQDIVVAGLLIQEDLVLMRHSPTGWRLVAASLCFPSAWNLHEKFGRPLHEIHQPVPGFGEGTRNASLIDRMFDNLRVEQPVIRWNWSLYGDAQLYHPASDNKMKNRFGDGPITGKVIMRLERQTLRKLPKSGDILFTIRIHNNPLEVLETHADGPALARSIATQVANLNDAEIDYKGLVGERPRLLQRLETLARIAPA
jgi:dimethylamine monooxygenase subunit A